MSTLRRRRHQSARLGKIAKEIYCWNCIARGECDELLTLWEVERRGCYDDGPDPLLGHGGKRGIEVTLVNIASVANFPTLQG